MRPRPQTNVRRGLLRAALVVIGLVALGIIVVGVVGSLTSGTAKAPTVPNTVGPVPTTTPSATAKPRKTSHAKTAPATPKPTKGKKSSIEAPALGAPQSAKASAGLAFAHLSSRAAPHPRWAAYFPVPRHPRSRLILLHRASGVSRAIGWGYGLSKPVWSRGQRMLMYVQARQTHAFPLAHWTLLVFNRLSGRTQKIVGVNALQLVPLGWLRGNPLYLVAGETDTSLYRVRDGRPRLVSVLMQQPITSALLSPNGTFVAYTAPTDCTYCTIDFYDLATSRSVPGLPGMSPESALTWANNDVLLAEVHHRLAEMSPGNGVQYLPLPAGLPRSWADLEGLSKDGRLELVDTVTGTVYPVGRRAF